MATADPRSRATSLAEVAVPSTSWRPPGDGAGNATPLVDAALAATTTAAARAGVTIREVEDLEELTAVMHLYAEVWGRDAAPPLTTELLRAFAKAGNYVGGAFDGEQLVGACVGFFGGPSEDALHSHITGVAPPGLGRGVGFALKLHQRAWALLRDVEVVSWTFDPLVRRNAYFNVVKLAATPVDYLPNFYGAMADRINGDGDTDRLLVRWQLADDAVVAACTRAGRRADADAERAAGAVESVGVDGDGEPVVGPLHAAAALVAVPPDVERLRTEDPAQAQRWRLAVRDALIALTADGARITGFDPAGWYVLHHPDAQEVTS